MMRHSARPRAEMSASWKRHARGFTGPAQLAIRPRRVALHIGTDTATIPGKLLKATYVGTHMEYRVDTAHGEIFAISGDVSGLHHAGSDIRVGFKDPGPVLLPAT